jgi:hypothetical protein
MVGYFTAWILTFYVPGKSELNFLNLAAFLAIPLIGLLVLSRMAGMIRFGVSWFLVATAAAYLWTSSTFDADVRQLADTTEFGVFVADIPGNVDAVTSADLTIDGSRAVLEVGTERGSEKPLILVVGPTRPDGCSEYGTFGGSTAYACVAPVALQFEDAVSYSWSGAALEAGGVSIFTANGSGEIGELQVVAVPVNVTFATYSFDDQRIFNRPLLGVAALDQYAITYVANAQTLSDDQWTAVVEYRFPRGVALLSIARDLSLILLGGAVSLFLIPQRYTRKPEPVAASTDAPRTDVGSVLASGHQPRLATSSQVPTTTSLVVGSVLVTAVLVALRWRRGPAS